LFNEILELADKNNIIVVEDAAHAHGATLNGKKAGSFGDLGVFSFYPDKVIASADGGIIVTDNKNYCEKILSLRNLGRKYLGNYDFSMIGYNYRMNEIQAILALEQLSQLPLMLKKRRRIASIYDSKLGGLENLQIPSIPLDAECSYYAYIVRLTKGSLNKFRGKLSALGIETSPMFRTLYKTKLYENLFGKHKGLCPVSERLDRETFTIPLHPGMANKEVEYVARCIKKLVK